LINCNKFWKKLELGYLSKLYGWTAEENWSDVLSLGEQQRLAFARLLFHKPKVAILDEATSALNVDLQQKVYKILSDSDPSMIIVSVAHRPELFSFHKKMLKATNENAIWKFEESK